MLTIPSDECKLDISDVQISTFGGLHQMLKFAHLIYGK